MYLDFTEEAAAEYAEVVAQLDETRRAAFMAESKRQMLLAVRFPQSGSPIPGTPPERDYRRYKVRGFFHSVVTASVGERLVVVAIAADGRGPEYWAEILQRARGAAVD